jgi:nucleoside-diphosphate-sugar epimerase
LPFGSANNKRSLLSVLNLCNLIEVCLTHPKAPGNIFLASDDHDESLKTLLQKVGKVSGQKLSLIPFPVSLITFLLTVVGKKAFADRLFGDLYVDVSETKKILSWSPPYTFEQTYAEEDLRK